MNATAIQMIEKNSKEKFELGTNAFKVKNFTQAPLRMQGEFYIDVAPEILFDRVTDPQAIAQWFGLVKSGSVDHSQSCTAGQWGEGSKRFCHTPMGTLNETIYYWQRPNISAYNVKSISVPAKDHCAVIKIEPLAGNKSKLIWLQYFNFRGVFMRFFFPKIMAKMMTQGVNRLANEYGGAGGKMVLVK